LVMAGARGGTGDYITRYTAGQPAWVFYGYQTTGVYQDTTEIKTALNITNYANAIAKNKTKVVPGDVRYADLNQDGQINNRDQTYLGSPWPKWTFGLNLSCEYKGFDLNATFYGVQGNKIFYYTVRADHTEFNKPEYFYTEAWHGPGTTNSMPRATIGDGGFGSNNYLYSNLDIFSGDFIKLKNLTLGYTLPAGLTSKIGISKLKVYVSAINLLTITNYPGADPEIGQDINNGNSQSFGVDRGNYPSSKSYNVGVNVTF
jgi:TonB-dependent starch-binding outer membrane protein SusC